MEDLKLKNSTFTFTPTSSVVPIFELKENGDMLVKGNLIENYHTSCNKEVKTIRVK